MDKKNNQSISFVFVGDLSPSCIYSRDTKLLAQAFKDVRSELPKNSILFFNLECSLFFGEEGTFTEANLESLQTLVHLKPAVANLANNHHFDSGISGSEEIANLLESIGIPSVGIYSKNSQNNYDILDINGIKIGIVSRLAKGTNPKSFGNSMRKIIPLEYEELNQTCVKLIKEVDFTIVCLHWGAEYYSIPSPKQKKLATDLSKLGVDILWGHHAHVLQDRLIINKTLVLYNLGNFVFGESSTFQWPSNSRKSVISIYELHDENFQAWQIKIKCGISGNTIFDNSSTNLITKRFYKNTQIYILDLIYWFVYRIYMELVYFGFRYIQRKISLKYNKNNNNEMQIQNQTKLNNQSLKMVIRERLRRIIYLWEDE